MKRVICTLVIVTLLLVSCGGKSGTTTTTTTKKVETKTVESTEVVKLGIFNLAPFLMEIEGSQKLGGATIDYWEKIIAPDMGVKIEVVGPFPFLRLSQMLENGEVDCIPQITKNPDREKKFLYPTNKFSQIVTCLVVLNDSPITKITKQEDLFGVKIGFFEGATIPDFMVNDNIPLELITESDYRQINLDKLAAKRIDAMFDLNLGSMLYDIVQKGFKDQVRTVLLPLPEIPVYSVFTKSERGERLIQLYNKANDKVYKTSTFDGITETYMK